MKEKLNYKRLFIFIETDDGKIRRAFVSDETKAYIEKVIEALETPLRVSEEPLDGLMAEERK